MKPAVIGISLASGLIEFVVTLGYHPASHEQLTVIGRGDLDTWDRFPDRSDLESIRHVGGGGAGCLRHPIKLIERNPYRHEELDEIGVDWRCSGNGNLDLVHAKPLSHLGEDDLVEETGHHRATLALHLGVDPLCVGGKRQIDKPFLQTLFPGEPGHQTCMELLVDARHCDKKCGLRRLDVLEHGSDRRAVPNLSGEIGAEIVGGQTLGNMGQGQVGHHAHSHLEVGSPPQRLQCPHHVVLADHHPLGGAGGARGVDQGGEGFRRYRRSRPGHRFGISAKPTRSSGEQLVPAENPVNAVVILGTGHEDDVAKVGELGPYLLPSLHVIQVLEDCDRRPAIVCDVLDLIGRECGVDGHRGSTGVDHTKVGDHVLGSVPRHHSDKLALADTEGLETGGHLMHDTSVL